MHNTKISTIQAVLVLIVTLLNASFQTYSLQQLRKTAVNDPLIDEAKNILLNTVITQYIIAVFVAIMAFILFAYRHRISESKLVNVIVYLGLIVSTVVMFVGGVFGALVASKIQCFKQDKNVHNAWRYSTVSAINGIVGTILVLLVQGFIRRDNIHEYLKNPTFFKDKVTFFKEKPAPAVPLRPVRPREPTFGDLVQGNIRPADDQFELRERPRRVTMQNGPPVRAVRAPRGQIRNLRTAGGYRVDRNPLMEDYNREVIDPLRYDD